MFDFIPTELQAKKINISADKEFAVPISGFLLVKRTEKKKASPKVL